MTTPVLVHLPGGCRKRKLATSTDPLATSCRACLKSKRWHRVARSMIRAGQRAANG